MRKWYVILMGIFFLANGKASETSPETLNEQISAVKEYLKKIQHPRLILGVPNTELSSSTLPGPNPFLHNPSDILLDMVQQPGILTGRTLTVNFSDLPTLQKLADRLENSFDIITADYLVTKYMADWTGGHLNALKKMLKPGGKLILPLDIFSSRAFNIKNAASVEDMFKQASQEAQLGTTSKLAISNGWSFTSLPTHLSGFSNDIDSSIKELFEKYKEAKEFFNISTPGATQETRAKLKELGLNPSLVSPMSKFPEALAKGDEALQQYATNQVVALQKAKIQPLLFDRFMIDYVIPLNIKRIAGEVFGPDNIVVQKGIELPQPHREHANPSYYTFVAIK